MPRRTKPARRKVVVIVGAGGNIGSHLVQHIGRMPEVGWVILIDPDVYELANLEVQMIDAADVGRTKVAVQASRLRRLRADLGITAIAAPIESVPLGRLRSDLILACLDSRRSRREVNRVALRLGIPFIDAGVDAAGLLARISAYRPGSAQPCLECSFGERDYEMAEPGRSCLGEPERTAPTGSPSSLGALAASLQAIECRKLLGGGSDGPAFGHQVLVDAAHHRILRTRYAANPACRLGDHDAWRIEPLRRAPAAISVAAALTLGPRSAEPGIFIEGSPFQARHVCPGCGAERALLRHRASLQARRLRCRACRADMVAVGFDMQDRLERHEMPHRILRRSLGSLGLRVGDVFGVGEPKKERFYEFVD